MSKLNLKQRKALRSAAARKGWETRIARERREIEAAENPITARPAALYDDLVAITAEMRGVPPDPFSSLAAWIKAQWQRVLG